MVSVIRAMCVASAMLCLPTVAAAQPGVPSQNEFTTSIVPGKAAPLPAPQLQGTTVSRRRDTLWNGVIIGAGVGALFGALGGQAILDCSECAGFNVPLTFGVLGAGVGAGIGAGIDALRHTRSPIPNTPGKVTVAPLLGKGQRAVVAHVRF